MQRTPPKRGHWHARVARQGRIVQQGAPPGTPGAHLEGGDLAPCEGVGRDEAQVVGLLVAVSGALHAPRPNDLQRHTPGAKDSTQAPHL